jgi:hypothetical protein
MKDEPTPLVVPAPGSPLPTPPNIQPVVPQITDPTYEGVTVDTSYTPRSSLLTYVEGSNWTVVYYRQLIGRSNQLSAQDTAMPGANQQYERISNMLIKVTSPLSTTQDEESKSMILTGTGLVTAGVIPNVGDIFVADTGDGKISRFQVTTSEKKSFLKDAVYEINYVIKGYADPKMVADLDAKTVTTMTFVAGNLMIGQNPIIANSELLLMQQLQTQMRLLISQYFQTFFSVEWQTLLVPDQIEATYDPFLVRAILDFITTDENPVVQRIRAMNVQGDQAFNAKTIWDCFRTMRMDYLPLTQQQIGLANMKRVQNRWPYFMSAFYSGITFIVYPIDARMDVDAHYVQYPNGYPATFGMSEGRPRNPDLSRILSVTDTTGFSYLTPNPQQLPDIVPVAQDQYYVFREGFYGNTPTPSSNLELIALQALQGQAIDLGQLLRLATNAPVWGNLERFYYVPVLIALIKANIGNI